MGNIIVLLNVIIYSCYYSILTCAHFIYAHLSSKSCVQTPYFTCLNISYPRARVNGRDLRHDFSFHFFNNCINRFNFTLAQINIRWFFEIGVTAKINLNYKPESSSKAYCFLHFSVHCEGTAAKYCSFTYKLTH